MEGFLFPFGRSQDSIKSRSKTIFLFFVLATVYVEKGKIARKAPFHSGAFTLKVFGAELGNLFARIKNTFSELIETVCNSQASASQQEL